jgi:hypothetical protein
MRDAEEEEYRVFWYACGKKEGGGGGAGTGRERGGKRETETECNLSACDLYLFVFGR